MILPWGVAFVLAGLGTWALIRLWRIAAIGSAYKAKVLCSIIFGTGRTIDPQRADEVTADSYRMLRLVRARVNQTEHSVTASLLGMRTRTAFHRPGLGATLLFGRPSVANGLPPSRGRTAVALAEAGRTVPIGTPAINGMRGQPPHGTAVRVASPWPIGAASPAVEEVIESSFTEPDPTKLRRTRAIVVVQDGRIIGERYAPGFSETSRFAGWSMTKSVLGALIGILVGQGSLSLDKKALVPEWQPPDPRAEISLEDLLRMRSGLAFSEVYSDLSSDVIEMLFNQPDAAAYAAGQPLAVAAGTTWSYSSGTTNILSAIARKVVGDADYLEWPRRVLFDPIGMSSAVMEPDASGTFVGSSFMLATARDWARFGQLFLQDGVWEGQRIIPEGWVRFSVSPTPQSPTGVYGAHWWRRLHAEMGGATPAAARIPSDAYFAVGHEGQTLTVIPSHRLVVVRLGLSIYIDAWNHAAFLADLQDALDAQL